MGLIGAIVIGLLAGFLAGRLFRGRGFGLLGNIVIGLVGAMIGSFLFGLVGLAAYGLIAKLVMASLGAVVLLFIASRLR